MSPTHWRHCTCEAKPLAPGEPMPGPDTVTPHDSDCPCAPRRRESVSLRQIVAEYRAALKASES